MKKSEEPKELSTRFFCAKCGAGIGLSQGAIIDGDDVNISCEKHGLLYKIDRHSVNLPTKSHKTNWETTLKLKIALRKDFDVLYQKEFTTDWKAQRIVRGIEIDVMGLDNLEKVFANELSEYKKGLVKEKKKFGMSQEWLDGYNHACELAGLEKELKGA